jgi:hypothetical protein
MLVFTAMFLCSALALAQSKKLPSVDARLVADCKAKHPKFGGGKVGSTK